MFQIPNVSPIASPGSSFCAGPLDVGLELFDELIHPVLFLVERPLHFLFSCFRSVRSCSVVLFDQVAHVVSLSFVLSV